MAISYNDWKKQYDALDSAWKQRYADLTKGSALWQQYMNQYNSEKNTPTIWGQPIKTYQVAKNDTPTIWWQTIQTKTPTTNNPTIWWKPLLNNGTRPVWESILWWKGIQEVDVSWSNQNSTPATWTRPVWESILWWNNIKEVDISNNNSKPKSIFDKPENPVSEFKVLWINPFWKWTEQKWKTTTKQPSVSTPRNQWYVNPVTPKQVEWDYQDNSQARMDQIADNLNKYTQTNPELFKDYDTFYNFFIAWKGRSEDQKRFLDQYYANYKQNEKYNNMSPTELGNWMANWQIPEDYINTVNATDPTRAAAIKDSLKDAQDWIANEGYLSELAGLSGFHAWNAKEMLYRDVNKDWLDDRLYHEPTEEERKLVDENSELEAERLKLSNSMKDLQSDLTDQYPDADLSTIMLLTSDRWQKIQKALDTLNVTQTKLQWTIKYLQTERTTMDKAWFNTISELQKNYWMYRDSSAEWIKAKTQAEYEATHITLDQADSWTETDKQIALDNVLKWYYDKYGSIIQRSQQQVINDVIAESKRTWKTLSQALEDNFLKHLRAKPEFASLSNWWLSPKVSFEKVWDNWYILTVNPDGTYSLQSVNWGAAWTNAAGNMFQFTNYTPITEEELDAWLQSFMKDHPLNSTWGQCGRFVNNYLKSLWYEWLYTDPIDKKKAITNTDIANVWAIAVMNSKKYPANWHTAIVTDIQWDKVKLLESNWNDDEKVHERWVNKSEILGYFDPSKATSNTSVNNQLNSKFSWPDWNPNGYFNSLAWDFKSYIKDGKLQLTKDQYASLKETYWINDQEFRQMAANYANSELKGNWWQQAANALNYAIKTYEYLYGKDYDWLGWNAGVFRMWGWFLPWTSTEKAKWEYDSLMKRLSLKELFDAKALWATFWAMSDAEWSILENAATDLNWYHTNFKENLEDLIESLYDATLDWNASLPKNYTGSSVETLINDRKSAWDGVWLTQEEIAANKQAQQTKFNVPKYATSNNDLWWDIDWDAIWNS